jgi:SpoIIAA-like
LPIARVSHDELEAMLMLRQMRDMPVGTIGFEAVGEVEDDDWEDTVEPLLRQEIAEGRKVRLLYLLGPGAPDVEGDALKADTGFRARHAASFDRVAVVSDEDWMRPALGALSFLLPGKAKGFRVADLADAKAWLAADSD